MAFFYGLIHMEECRRILLDEEEGEGVRGEEEG
jgi:hypothetical protein